MKHLRIFSLLVVVVLTLVVSAQTSALTPEQPASVEPPVANTPTPASSTPQPPVPGLDIVGGQEADPDAWPWMAALVFASQPNAYYGQFCGGALIRPTWVLTAAHCTEDNSASDIEVVIGRHQLSDDEDGERISVAEIIQHPAYNSNTLDSDLALLHLSSASSQPTISVVGSGDSALFAPGVLATVIGWGLTDPNDNSSYVDALRQVSVPIVSNTTCNAPNAYSGDVTANMLCAGYSEGGKDSCSGDSGGPFMVPDAAGTGWLQAGIVSWGDGCAEPNKYGVYTRVANFKSWIDSHVGAASTPTATATGGPSTATPTSTRTATATPTPTTTRTATITPTSSVATPTATLETSPTTTPTATPSPTLPASGSQQLLDDPSFEIALFASPWDSAGDVDVLDSNNGFPPAHTGVRFASLLSFSNSQATLYQTVDIPTDISSAVLRFWWRTTDSFSVNARLRVQVRDSSGDVLDTLATLNTTGPANWTQSDPLDVTAYAGQQVQIAFRARSTSTWYPDYFDLDDVTLEVSAAACCDFNSNGSVDVGDAQIVAADWGASGSPYDFNDNGRVDVADVMYVVSQLSP